MIEKLIELIASVGITHYGKSLRTKNKYLLEWIMQQTNHLPEISLGERVYIVLNGENDRNCEYESIKTFNTLTKGYRFCANNCRCRREEQSRKIIAHAETLSEEERQRRVLALQETFKNRYGVTNPMHLDVVKEKVALTNLDNLGVIYPGQSDTVKRKIKETNLERYGCHPSSLQNTKEKAKKTNLKRYGSENTMSIARDSYKERTGVDNPFLLPEIQEKAKNAMLAKYGVEKPLQNEVMMNKMKDNNVAKYGVSNVMQNSDISEKLRKNRRWTSQKHFSDETIEILQNKDKFSELLKQNSIREASQFLEIGYDTIRKYCEKYEIDIPKSSYEKIIADFMQTNGFDVDLNNRTIIKPYELDIVIHSHKLAIEFCGLYWHSDVHIADTKYHLNKLDRTVREGYRLITIFEDEWLEKRKIVESRLLHILGKNPKSIGARHLSIRPIIWSEAQQFLHTYHIQGAGPAGFAKYGAFNGDVLVAVMTFSNPRIALGRNKGAIELLRYATDGGSYPGAASRLFKLFIKEYSPTEVISYADRRWSDGGLYRNLGFEETNTTDPNYWYIHPNTIKREHRFKYRKDRIIERVENGKNKTEGEIMKELGYNKMWDCGSFKFKWDKI